MKKTENKGITLIALIITIIIMLILVVVSVTILVKSDLIGITQRTAEKWQNETDRERSIGTDIVIGGKTYASIEDYVAGNEKVTLPEGWREMTDAELNAIANGDETKKWDTSKVTPITDGKAGNPNYVPLPKGYSIVQVDGKAEVDSGLVIKDSHGNEFVWIPIPGGVEAATIAAPYDEGGLNYNEPKILNSYYDGQTVLDNYYGTNHFNFNTDFDYGTEYEKMAESVNKYKGFFVGRYETTIDNDGNIGSVYNTPVLTADKTMFTKDSTAYPYSWYGMYYAQKTTDYIDGNGDKVQSAMIYGQLWDKMIAFFEGKADYTAIPVSTKTSTGNVINSAKSTYSYNSETINDVILNIYDLRRNGHEWTQEAYDTYSRVLRRRPLRQ